MKKIEKIFAILLLSIAGSSTARVIIPTSHDYIERCNGSTTCNLFTAWKENAPIYCPCIPYEKSSYCTGYHTPDYGEWKSFSWYNTATFCGHGSSNYEQSVPQGNGVFEIYTCRCSDIKYTFQCNDYAVELSPDQFPDSF